MIDRKKKLPARFYVAPSGRLPVREWLLALSEEDRRTVGKDMQKVEFGWPIGMPLCRPLGDGLWEVRSNLASNRIARVLFCLTEGRLLALHGLIKKTQKTPDAELELARKRMSEFKQQKQPKKPKTKDAL